MGLVNCKYNFECWTISILKRTYGHKSVSLAIHTVLQLINDINRACFSKPSLQNESFMHSFKYVCNLSWVQSGKLQKAKVATIEAENFLPATPTLCHVLVWNLESCPLKSIDMFASNPVGRKSWLSERKKPAAQSLTSKEFDQILRLIEWETRREREREREHLLQFFTESHEGGGIVPAGQSSIYPLFYLFVSVENIRISSNFRHSPEHNAKTRVHIRLVRLLQVFKHS